MSVKAEMAFDVCWEVYRGAPGHFGDEAGRGGAGLAAGLEIFVEAGPASKVERLGGGFCVGGAGGMAGPERASRMVMFRLYYLGLAEYGQARHFLGLSERGLGELVGGDSAEMRGGDC